MDDLGCFVRSGDVNLNIGHLYNSGVGGYYRWSALTNTFTSATGTNSYNFNFDASGVNPSNNGNRWVGRPLHYLGFIPGSVPVFLIQAVYRRVIIKVSLEKSPNLWRVNAEI